MPCTGKCCQDFCLSVSRLHLRHCIDIDQSVEAAKIWALVREVDPHVDEFEMRYRCVALTSSGCSLAREDRPDMCNEHPRPPARCGLCGARSDQEARGVALVATS